MSFALDGKRTGVADVTKLTQKSFDSDSALTERLLYSKAPATERSGQFPSLQCTERTWAPRIAESFDRIPGAVENHIGRVEIDAEIVAIYVMNEIEQNLRRSPGRFRAQTSGRALPRDRRCGAPFRVLRCSSGSAASSGTKPM